ncbi:inhibitor of growth protein 1 [Anthonomus grandis grandis]|uniref:inhibitor of growth protein 1 n=1 Tax=Anthonomus grandis grandis TaxID=2921223 RepID=UPI00216524CF|nr:inhibitor of growth protein 1 [Anthonomus grandis grandis]
MLNQVNVEALYSATYVENYLDCVENFPNELQRLISRMRELDVYYLAHVREIQNHQKNLKECTSNKQKDNLFKRMQQALIAAQELGDEKMSLLQSIHDKIELKTRGLDQDYKNLDISKEEPAPPESKEPQTPVVAPVTNTPVAATNSVERPIKRARRTRNEKETVAYTPMETSHAEVVTPEHSLRSQAPAVSTNNTTSSAKKTTTGKKKKRKTRQIQAQKEDSPPPEEQAVDPDEPTYCLCDQISYGEMIMCDNDLCPIEWFHFSCVTLTTKPKGKWYCPKCRGDRPNVMKPKAQFLKELEKYNKEKEEKT